MSYNGIGLSTARGSGTNGFVQKNVGNKETLGQYERRKQQQSEKERQYDKTKKQNRLKKDDELIEHESKRQIELRCSLLRDKLEDDDNLSDEEIEKQVNELRIELIAKEETKKRIYERNKAYRTERDKRERRESLLTPNDDTESRSEAQNFIDSFKTKEIDY